MARGGLLSYDNALCQNQQKVGYQQSDDLAADAADYSSHIHEPEVVNVLCVLLKTLLIALPRIGRITIAASAKKTRSKAYSTRS
jgi:hypothetical protein